MMGKRKGKAWRNVQIQKRELRAKRIGRSQENQQKISKIDKRIESIDNERKSLRKELSRVRSYQRVTGGRNRKVRFSEIKAKAKTGGSLSTLELDALLGSGNLSDLAGSKSGSGAKSIERKTDTPKKRRKIGVSRRGRERKPCNKQRRLRYMCLNVSSNS